MADAPETPENAEAQAPAPRSKKKLILLVVVALAVLGGGAFALLGRGEKELTPPEKLAKSLELLAEHDSAEDRILATKLIEDVATAKYTDPDFSGAVPYVRGMLQFYEARDLVGVDIQKPLLKAIDFLEEARLRTIPAERRHELDYALGASLQLVGLKSRAREFLEDALEHYEPERQEISKLLLGSYLEEQSEESLQKCVQRAQELLKDEEMPDDEQELILIQYAQALQLLDRTEEAEKVLTQSESKTTSSQQSALLKVRSLMANADKLRQRDEKAALAKYLEAQQMLQPLLAPLVKDRVASQANFLMARCAVRLHNDESAINYFQQIVRKYPTTHEGIASHIELADLFRRLGRDEEAIDSYRRALKTIRRPEDFRNRWLTVRQFQDSADRAWDAWAEAGDFDLALAVASEFTPLFSLMRATERLAETHQRWAQKLQAEFDAGGFDKRMSLAPELRQRWRDSGKAYSQLAELVRPTKGYAQVVWQSAVHYANGNDFETSLKQTAAFLDSAPQEGVAQAVLHRGRMQMHLDKLPEAIESFRQVVREFPRDPSTFEARLSIGHCFLEQNKLEDAEKTWRELMNGSLDPLAKEWRDAKFALSQLLVERATNAARQAVVADGQPLSDSQKQAREQAFELNQEAIRHLDEYIRRYPTADSRFEARQLMARALRFSIGRPQEQLQQTMPAAARQQLHKEVATALDRALQELRTLQEELQGLHTAGRLDRLGQQLYRETFLSIPDTLFEQELFDDALDEYRSILNRFPEHPMSLTAYVQMARCHERQGRPEEARMQFEQARQLLQRLPDTAFVPTNTSLTRADWSAWLDWAQQVRPTTLRTAAGNAPNVK